MNFLSGSVWPLSSLPDYVVQYYPVYAEDNVFGLLILQNYKSSPSSPRIMKTMFLERIGLPCSCASKSLVCAPTIEAIQVSFLMDSCVFHDEVFKGRSRDIINGKLIDLEQSLIKLHPISVGGMQFHSSGLMRFPRVILVASLMGKLVDNQNQFKLHPISLGGM